MNPSEGDRQAEIYGCFDGLQDIHEGKSTEFLLQLTADVMKCSYEDVAAALQAYTLAPAPEPPLPQPDKSDDDVVF